MVTAADFDDLYVSNSNGFVDWLTAAKAGGRCIYHRGFLARDRDKSFDGNHELNLLADMAGDKAKAQKVALTQKRLGDGDYLYFASRLPEPKRVM